jgi:murein DD-endopeptidase MepM/ murein hydrolase activator NlpD
VVNAFFRTKLQELSQDRNVKFILILTAITLIFPIAASADIELPVENGVVTSGVGWRIDPFGSGKLVFHRGIDIAVPVGSPVRATRKGHVVFAGEHRGHGSTVIMEHANGDRTLYGHNSLVRVHAGEIIEPGTVIAFSGSSGRSTGPHVHFELIASGRPVIDPTESEEPMIPQLISDINQRDSIEQLLDESVNSVIRTIKGTSDHPEINGQGG